ncbi:MAG: FAD-dependent oxidoreductase, partial [Chitinivibrionales bacterium]|nr:FAD-dependent oxidoreductase [Chitinivibrionales bacterium]
LLIERYGALGGMATFGEVHPFMPNHIDGAPMDGPVYTDWLDAMDRYGTRKNKLHISKDAAMLAAEDLCLDSGVSLLYHHQLADVLLDNDSISHAVLLSKSGLCAVKARMFIDCTGDADLAARAGCECEQGGPTGHCQPMTLCFKLSHVDRERVPWDKVNDLYDQARESGAIECPRHNVLRFGWLDDDVVHFNTTRVLHRNGVDGRELSDAEIEGRRQLRQFLAFFRSTVPGFENAQLHSVAHHIGIRETRRVRGMAYLTRDDFEQCRKFPDAVARVNYPIDIHNPDGGGTEHAQVPEGDWYEITYGCVVARDRANLLVGGRPISVDHAVHSSMRVMPPACTVGQAAGMAAALAVKHESLPKDLDGVEVRRELVARGAKLA